MKSVIFALVLVGCVGGAPPDQTGGSDSPDGGTTNRTCPLPNSMADTGNLSATKAQRCNVNGSGGAQHWWRLAATLPSGAMDYIQVELWDGSGAFTGGTVHTGTFTIAGADADYGMCGVCVRGIGHKGAADAKEYFGTSGTVTISAVGVGGQPLSATVSNIGFVEVDTTMHKPVANGCSTTVASSAVSGTVVDMAGGGGGGGGGGGMCPAGVGD